MSFAEFKIRLHGHKRSRINKLKLHREVLWTIYGSGFGEKKIKDIKKFYPIEGDSEKIDDNEMLSRIKREQEKYLQKVNG